LDVVDRDIAYAGEIGRQREEFCVTYSYRKQESYRRIQQDIFAQIAAGNGAVTCHKGCSDCCVLYVEADIQECEAIVYFLYRNPTVMVSFGTQYDTWRKRMRRLGDPFARCEEVLHENHERRLSQSDQALLLEALLLYHEQDLPCVFLSEGACSIYEVRPYVCVNHYVTSPQDWCRTANWCNPSYPHRPQIYMTTIDEIYDRSFYGQTLARPVVGYLPTTVYRILTEGLGYIAHLTGLETMLDASAPYRQSRNDAMPVDFPKDGEEV
jgi:Fe-S-cluster containining protein